MATTKCQHWRVSKAPAYYLTYWRSTPRIPSSPLGYLPPGYLLPGYLPPWILTPRIIPIPRIPTLWDTYPLGYLLLRKPTAPPPKDIGPKMPISQRDLGPEIPTLVDRMTDACENITFPQLLLRVVIIENFLRVDKTFIQCAYDHYENPWCSK